MAQKFNEESYLTFSQIVARKDTAANRLRELFHYDLARTYSAIEDEAKILEVAEVLSKERPVYMNDKLAQERVFLVRIMDEGVAAGEFRPLANPDETAEMWQSAPDEVPVPAALLEADPAATAARTGRRDGPAPRRPFARSRGSCCLGRDHSPGR